MNSGAAAQGDRGGEPARLRIPWEDLLEEGLGRHGGWRQSQGDLL